MSALGAFRSLGTHICPS